MLVTLDFETFYSTEYSLSRLRTEEYVLDPRFEAMMVTVAINEGPIVAAVGDAEIRKLFKTIPWDRAAVLAQNTRFDASIAAWHYGVKPKLWLDTLSMARACTHTKLGRSSLKKLAEYFGLPAKGNTVAEMRGKRLADLTPQELVDYIDYCKHDTWLCREIAKRFLRVIPKSEIMLMDMTVRMFVEPVVHLDPLALAKHKDMLDREFAIMMAKVDSIDPQKYGGPKDTVQSIFSSTAKFKALLEDYGVDVPMKRSPATGKIIAAVAKNDREFKEMLQDDTLDPFVQVMLAARVGVKSTIEMSRTATLQSVAKQPWQRVGMAPHLLMGPLKYYAAHTGRFGGDNKMNLQNLRRGSPLEGAIVAPPGYVIIHRDASQIEARMLAWLAGCQMILDAFRNKRDLYCEFASIVYGRTITKADKLERFVGKTCTLGLGYQTGWQKLRHTLFLGNGGISVNIDEAAAKRIVRTYRETYPEIPALWQSAEELLRALIEIGQPITHPNLTLTMRQARRLVYEEAPKRFPVVEISTDTVWLPNGMPLNYPNIREEKETDENGRAKRQKYYDGPYGPTHIYGGKTTENIDQALSRIVVMDVALAVKKETDYWPFLSTHDSLDYCVPEDHAEMWHEYLAEKFAQVPAWAPALPLASEGGWGKTMAEAKKER